MSEVKLSSGDISAVVNAHGAELKSLKKGDKEYLWQADPAFWARSSPVLFPFVGAVANGEFTYQGVKYPMGQHGFARDMDFTLEKNTETSCQYVLVSNEETMKKYPLPFELRIGYTLKGESLEITWEVKNPGTEVLPFSIGAHPAFNCILKDTSIRILKEGKPVEKFVNSVFGKGLLTNEKKEISLPGGVMELDEHSFDGDAFVIEDSQTDCVEILHKGGEKILSVTYTSPLVGIWSPPGKNAPFLCIEPWYGRADKEGFEGELKDREWNNSLNPGDTFCVSYQMNL